jgi:hypothetical protein
MTTMTDDDMAEIADRVIIMAKPDFRNAIIPITLKIKELTSNPNMDECADTTISIVKDTFIDYTMPIMRLLAGITKSTNRDEDIRNYRENHKFDFDYEQLQAWKAYLLQIEGGKVKQLTKTVKDTRAEAEQNQIRELTDLTNDLKTELSKVSTDQDRKADELKEEHTKQLTTLQTQRLQQIEGSISRNRNPRTKEDSEKDRRLESRTRSEESRRDTTIKPTIRTRENHSGGRKSKITENRL